ncbi:MAG TPA: TonB-dependent receptor [Candidatus Methylacidiphilales bacterium]
MQRISVTGAAVAVAMAFSLLPAAPVRAASASTSASSASSSASASSSDDSSAPLDPVIVTATRLEEPLSQTSSSVTVVTAREIEDNGYVTLAQALGNVPGVRTAAAGGYGQNTGLFIRGMATNENLILVDGKRLPQDLAGAYDLADLPLDNVERIEVARGPLSAVQGNSAAGGVINIITKTGRGLKKPEYTVAVEAGSYNTFREVVTARGAEGKFDYSAAYSSLLTSNQRRNNDYERENGTVNLGWQAYPDVRLSLDSSYRVTTVQNPGPNRGFNANDQKAWNQTETWTVSPTLDWKTTDFWSQSLSYQHSQQRTANENDQPLSFSNNNRNQVNSNEADWNHTFTPVDTLRITAGTQLEDKNTWQYDDGLSQMVYNNHQTNKSGYAGLDWEALPDWHLAPSVRMDGFSDYGDWFNWRAATSYVTPVTRTKVKGSYGTATTAPADQNFMSFGGSNIVNYGLRPEQTRGWEAGAEQPLLGGKWTLGATYFENTIDNQITTLTVDPTLGTFTSANIARARSRGTEVTTGIHPLPQLDVTASYTWLQSINAVSQERLVRRPGNETSFDIVGRPVKGVVLSLGGSWLDNMKDNDAVTFKSVSVPDIFTTRFAASWTITKNVEVFGRIENLLNNQYEEIPGYPALDQAFYAGFKLTY